MQAIPKPTIDVTQLFGRCVSNITDTQRSIRLRAVAPTISAQSLAYERAAVAGELSALARTPLQPDSATKDDLEWLYNKRFAGSKSIGRTDYDAIMLGAPSDICPMCGAGRVRNLDHHLPISVFPTLAITPSNLVPVCVDCNNNKKDKLPSSEADRFFHPYFDQVPADRWLYASVVVDDPLTLHFMALPPTTWAESFADRVKHHFGMLGLAKLYAMQSSTEIASMSAYIRDLRTSAGASGVRAYYEDRSRSAFAADPNSWRTAMYHALVSAEVARQLPAIVQASS